MIDALARRLARAASLPRCLYKTSIPFVLGSSGSMGNNGALTLTTALWAILPQAWVYLPAGAIVVGSAAGWYYAVFSSTTVAQVFNNTYTLGSAQPPASPTAFVTTGPGAYTQVTTLTQAVAHSLPANTLTANGIIRIEGGTRTNNDASVKTLTTRLNTTSLSSSALTSSGGSAFLAVIKGANATNRQISRLLSGNGSAASGNPGVTAVVMTNAVTLNLALTLADAADYIVITDMSIWLDAR